MVQDLSAPPKARSANPVFLEPQTYRRRRLMDAARLLPAVGALLWMIPLLWPTGSSEVANPVSMSTAILYIFAVWLGLILIAAGIWVRTRTGPSEDPIDQLDGSTVLKDTP
jgi:hypothetical protein